MKKAKSNMQDSPVEFGKTYETAFVEFKKLLEAEHPGMVADLTLTKRFSDWLDRTKFLTPQIALLGMTEARKVDHAVMQALIDEIGEERAKEVIAPIVAKYQRGPAR